jgi:hypothetical protein
MILLFFADALYGAQGIILYIILAMIGILWNLARQCRSVPSAVTDSACCPNDIPLSGH